MTRECFHVINTFGSHIISVLMIFLLPNFLLMIVPKESKKVQIFKNE